MKNNEIFNWQESLALTYQEFTNQIIAFAPQLIGAIMLMIFGWIIAFLLRVATRNLVRSFDSIFNRLTKTDRVSREVFKRSYANIFSKIVFWAVMLFFIAAAVNMLGWNMFSNWMSSIVAYLPNLIAGLIIILAGFLIGNIAKTGIVNTAKSTGIRQGDMLARITQVIIIFTTLVVGIEQIGINVSFLTNVLIVVIGVLLAGGTLAFSFGAKTLVANIIGAQYVRKHCRIGEQMSIRNATGNIVEVTQTTIILDTGTGRTVIPAKYFQEQISSFTSPHKENPHSSENATS